jgi:hypothetical protein
MSHLISIEIDRDLAVRVRRFLRTQGGVTPDDADELISCITEALEQDDAVDE